jgi:hypothetical protein
MTYTIDSYKPIAGEFLVSATINKVTDPQDFLLTFRTSGDTESLSSLPLGLSRMDLLRQL